MQRRIRPVVTLVVAFALMRPCLADDFAPVGPGGDGTQPPPGYATPFRGSAYGMLPGPPQKPTDPVRPASWPGVAPAPLSDAPAYQPPIAYPPQYGQPSPYAGTQIIARVGGEIVLSAELLTGLDDVMKNYKDNVSQKKYEEQRKQVAQEVMAAIGDMAAHSNDPNPLAGVEPQHLALVRSLLRQHIETKLIYNDARHTIPSEAWDHVEESLTKMFDESELKTLLKRADVQSRQELDQKLRSMGSSLESEKRAFSQRASAFQWMSQESKIDDEVAPQEMLNWYQSHLSEFEKPARARWEELMVRFTKYPSKDAAYAAIARLGDDVVLRGVPLAQVAKAQSDGPTASTGGLRDWTSKGCLVADQIDRALFGLPLGQLSPILESNSGFHIIRVVEREDVTRKPFAAVQDDIKNKIRKERTNRKLQEYVAKLQKAVPVWTIFDDPNLPAGQLIQRSAASN